MKIQHTAAFISHALAWALALIGSAGTGCIAIVWQQQRIAETANSIKQIEIKIAETDRHQMELTSRIAAEQTLEALLRRNADFNLGLTAVREQQIVRIDFQPEQRLATKRNAELFSFAIPEQQPSQGGVAQPASLSTPVAVRFVGLNR